MAFQPIQILINAKDNASSVFGSLQAKVLAVGTVIATYFGINAFAGVVQGAADLETAMSRVQAATGASAEEMANLRKAAEDAGANTKFTSTEAAGALENLAKAGLNAGDAIATLPAVLNLAQAGDIGLADSSEILTKAITGLGLAFADSGRVADVLAKGANATNTSITGLAQALAYAAPVANGLGLSLESTVAIIGKFADAGIDASRAGTALNSILSQFSNPASKFREELAAAGITTGNFETALAQLAAAGPAGSKAIIAVGQEAGPALRALLNQGIGALDDLKLKLQDAQGSAAATAKVMEDNLNGSFRGLASAWDTVRNALGTPVLPVLKEGVDQLAAAFRNAVADGTVTKFGESIATAFKTGIQFVRDFIGTVDFGAVLTRLQDFANSANETFTRVGEYATNAGNTVRLAYGVMTSGANAVMASIYGIAASYTEAAIRIVQFAASASEALEKIAIGDAKTKLQQQAQDMREVLVGLSGVRDAFIEKTMQSLDATAQSAQTARDGFSGLMAPINSAGVATANWQKTVAAATAQMESANDSFRKSELAFRKQEEAVVAADRATVQHADKIRLLQDAYDGFMRAGNVNEAIITFDELQKAQRGVAQSSTDMAAAIAAAYKDLGIATDASLSETANRAKANFDLLTASGTASAREIALGFQDAAAKAIAANNGIAPSWVTAQASARGYKIEVDEAGKATVRSMKDAADATDRVRQAAGGAAGGYREMAGAAQQAAESAKKLQEIYDRNKVGNGSDKVGKSGDVREAAVMQYDINQDIAERYGDDAVGNDLAEQAWQLRQLLQSYQQNYGGARSQQSLQQQRNIGAELARVEAELKAAMGGGGGGGGTGGPASRPTPAGPSTSTPTVVNITVGGARHSINTDAAGARSLQDLIRQLEDDKGRS